MRNRIALITGANRGIGFEVCRQLAQNGAQVILTSRDRARGERAVEILRREGHAVAYCPLDVSDSRSVDAARAFVQAQFGRLDVLVNNAAVYLDEYASVFDVPIEVVRETLAINFYGPLYLCRAFAPLMQKQNYGRIVNVSSGMGAFDEMGGGSAAYRISKTALNALTVIMAEELRAYNIKVNAVCPGWVRTDMGGPNATRDLREGADTIVWLALLPDDAPSGGFFRDRQSIPW